MGAVTVGCMSPLGSYHAYGIPTMRLVKQAGADSGPASEHHRAGVSDMSSTLQNMRRDTL